MITVCLLGHSFVSGLLHHLSNNLSEPTPLQISEMLRLDNLVREFHLFGKRGTMLFNQSFQLPYSNLQYIQPDLVMLQYGSNDLAAGITPLEVSAKVVDLAREIIINVISVQKVVVLSALCRSESQPLNEKIYQYNGLLKDFCEVEENISCKCLQGFWQDPISMWSRDNIHPNTKLGRKRYKNDLRRVIFSTMPSIS